MKLSIRHDTTYSYADEVCTSIQFLRLTPGTPSASAS